MQRVREAPPEDAFEIAAVQVRSWQAAYRGLMPDDFLDRLKPEDRAGRYTLGSSNPADPQTLLALDEHERLLGFAAIAPSTSSQSMASCWRSTSTHRTGVAVSGWR
jgi:hypothetical protein